MDKFKQQAQLLKDHPDIHKLDNGLKALVNQISENKRLKLEVNACS